MPNVFYMKTGDTEPTLDYTLLDMTETPVPLAATTVELHMQDTGGLTTVFGPAEILDANAGQVRVTWPGPQLLSPGIYRAEWKVTWTDGTVISFPNDGYFSIVIIPSLLSA